MTKWDKLHAAFSANVSQYPAVLQVLADDLGVTPQSLQRLGVGYAPVVQYGNRKKGHKWNHDGWWAVPFLAADATVTGFATRGVEDGSKKFTWADSKAGLFYPVRAGYEPGSEAYRPGAHNWIRTIDAGLSCPVCDKPDGCLLRQDDPEDPAAVICCRIAEGADRPQDFGYLHILKPEGHLIAGGSPLPRSDHPYIVVEGMSDSAAVLDLGMIPVGRSSALFTKGLIELLAGQKVIILGENDEPDARGRRAGLDGMHKVSTLLHQRADTRMVLPPAGVKDFRTWKNEYGLTRDGFFEYVEGHHEVTTAADILPSGDPYPVADAWLTTTHTDAASGLPTLRKYGGQWCEHDGARYQVVLREDKLRGSMYTWLNGRRYVAGEDEVKAYVPTRSKVNDVMDALNAFCPIDAEPPCWLDDRGEIDAGNTIVYQNGVLDVAAYLAGEENYLTPPSTALFTLTALPYDFDPKATCPTWDKFVASVFADTQESESCIALLQEWFGYCMTADTSHEKLMLWKGPPGCGKGTSLTMLEALVGADQVATTKFGSLAGRFGLHPLLGKLVAVMPDARIPRLADPVQALETLLEISGNDSVNIDRKGVDELASCKLSVRFTIAVNELPELPDHSQALQRRLLLLPFDTSIKRPDPTLKKRLPAEASGVANWALEGLRRLRATGAFTVPAAATKMHEDFRRVTSPLVDFFEDCCVLDPTMQTRYMDMFEVWSGWAATRGYKPGHRTRFEQRLLAAYPTVKVLDVKASPKVSSRVFDGVQIMTAAKERYK